MPKLIVRRGPEPGKTFNVSTEVVQVGRGTRNDIVIEDNEVSREHCRLVRAGEYYELLDLDSSNGTFVNGHRVRENWPLRGKCLIELGDSITLEYQLGDETSATGEFAEADDAPPEMMELFFVVTVASQPNRAIYPLRGDKVDVGRGTTNDIIIVEAEMSRNHMRLRRVMTPSGELTYDIVDLNSTNGTTVNGADVSEPHVLSPGDVIRVGTSITIQFTNNPEAFLAGKATDLYEASDQDDMKTTRRNPNTLVQRSGVTGYLQPPPEPSQVGTGIEKEALADQVLVVYDRGAWESVVAPLVDALYQAEIPTWVEQYLTPGADDWRVAIQQARMECWMLLVVASPIAFESDYVVKTMRHFHNREKPILMLVHQPVERLPMGISQAPRIEFSPGHPDIAFQQIVNAIKQKRGG